MIKRKETFRSEFKAFLPSACLGAMGFTLLHFLPASVTLLKSVPSSVHGGQCGAGWGLGLTLTSGQTGHTGPVPWIYGSSFHNLNILPESHKALRWHLQAFQWPGEFGYCSPQHLHGLPLLWPDPIHLTSAHLVIGTILLLALATSQEVSGGTRLSWPSGAHGWPPESVRSSAPAAHRWPFPGEK